ncbi:hypothetical protein EDD22DRAFT_762099, partial [Suillus occidentalis]
ILEDANMLKCFWPKAYEYASYVHNQSPTKALSKITPNKVFHSCKSDVSTLHIFGSHCHIQVSPKFWKKLDAHSIDGILCGF